jgi:type IV secretion system protein VirB10
MYQRTAALLITSLAFAQEPEMKLKTREEVEAASKPKPDGPKDVWIVPAGTKIPIQLRQPVSTKTAQPGDAIYAQTTFPIVADGDIVIPAGTWVQGKVDAVKRAGRLKGTAEMQFHLTTLIYPNGYALDIAAAIDNVPGEEPTSMKEPGTVKRDSEKGKDLERIGTAASQGGQIGAIAGAATGRSVRSLGVGGLTGIAAGTLIGLLARGSDVTFETGKAVEISLSHAMAIERAPSGALAQ